MGRERLGVEYNLITALAQIVEGEATVLGRRVVYWLPGCSRTTVVSSATPGGPKTRPVSASSRTTSSSAEATWRSRSEMGAEQPEGVVLLGKAQEKMPVFRTEKRRNPQTGQCYPWIVRSTAMINSYYWYCLDREFGPFFLKFASYFPYNAKLCRNAGAARPISESRQL